MSHSVLLLFASQLEGNILFEKSGNQGESWHKAVVTWHSQESMSTWISLIVEATRVPNTHGEIAISALSFNPGGCFEKGEF